MLLSLESKLFKVPVTFFKTSVIDSSFCSSDEVSLSEVLELDDVNSAARAVLLGVLSSTVLGFLFGGLSDSLGTEVNVDAVG